MSELSSDISINGYKLIHKIGEGGFAEVWKVKDTNGKDLALKLYKSDYSLKQVKSYYNITKNFNHKNLLSPIANGSFEGRQYISYPLCEGSLMSLIQKSKELRKTKKRLTEEEFAKVIHDVSYGLQYLHDRGYIHNDLKPDNILYFELENKNHYLISDFDIIDEVNDISTINYSEGNAHAPGYASPELINRKPEKQSDVFSMGIMLYELATGNLPKEETGSGLGYLIQKSQELNVDELDNALIGFSSRLKNLVISCLSLNPQDRPTPQDLYEWSRHKLDKGGWPDIDNIEKSETHDVEISTKIESEFELDNQQTQRKKTNRRKILSLSVPAILIVLFMGLYEIFQYRSLNSAFAEGSINSFYENYNSLPSLYNSKAKKKYTGFINNAKEHVESFTPLVNGFSIGKKGENLFLLNDNGNPVIKDPAHQINRVPKDKYLYILKDETCSNALLVTGKIIQEIKINKALKESGGAELYNCNNELLETN